jgi:hypothetical protein
VVGQRVSAGAAGGAEPSRPRTYLTSVLATFGST